MPYLAFDFETSYQYSMGYDRRAYPVCLCVLTSRGEKYHWVFNHDTVEQAVNLQEIQDIFDSVELIIAHNIKFDLHWLKRLGINFSKVKLFCTQVAEYLINGEDNRVRYSLAETSLRYNIPPKLDKVKEWWSSGYETAQVPLSILLPYCYQDTANTLAIYEKQREVIKQKGLQKIVALSCEMSRILQEIEWNGMCIDIPKTKEYSEKYADRLQILNESLIKLVRSKLDGMETLPEKDTQGKSLPNFSSGDHLSAILFGGDLSFAGRIPAKKVGLEKNGKIVLRTSGLGFLPRDGTETSKAGVYQTDKAQLSELKIKNKVQKEFLELLQELTKLEKMKGTYFDGMLKHEIEGIVHCNIHQTRTVTGRFSATEPALQTIPRGSTSPIKEVFISRYE